MLDDAAGKEKRQYTRVDIAFPVQFLVRLPLDARVDFGEAPADGTAEDLSEGGMAFLCKYPFAENTVLEIRFLLLNTDISPKPHAFILSGEVRYRVEREGRYRIGVRFLNVSEDERRVLAQYVKFAQGRSDF